MRLTVDPDADALYLRLSDGKIEDSEQVASGVILDYDAQDNVVGIELLHLSKRVPKPDVERLLFRTGGREQTLVRETPPEFGKKEK